jgi:hypothetical protein
VITNRADFESEIIELYVELQRRYHRLSAQQDLNSKEGIKAAKANISLLVNDIRHRIAIECKNTDTLTYNEFGDLYEFVNTETTLKIHANDKFDKKFNIKNLSTQQMLVDNIRQDIYEIVELMAKKAATPDDAIKIIEAARNSSLVNEDLSNFTFFKLSGTVAFEKLTQLRSKYLVQNEIMNTPVMPGIGPNYSY